MRTMKAIKHCEPSMYAFRNIKNMYIKIYNINALSNEFSVNLELI